MLTMDAREAKQGFGKLLDEARRAPVAINKHGRKVAVLMAAEDFARFERFEELEDLYWGTKAEEAARGGYLSVEETAKLLGIEYDEDTVLPRRRKRLSRSAGTDTKANHGKTRTSRSRRQTKR